jgi:hypothetical protein
VSSDQGDASARPQQLREPLDALERCPQMMDGVHRPHQVEASGTQRQSQGIRLREHDVGSDLRTRDLQMCRRQITT